MERWAGKVALVTGASAGIGAAIVRELVKYDMKVVAVARRVDKIEELKSTVGGPGEVIPLKVDVSKEEEINKLFEWLKTNFGEIHVLINNAGIVRSGRLLDQDLKLVREVIELNVIGLVLCTQLAIKLMKETGVNDGHIIHINSIGGHGVLSLGGEPGTGIYSATKYAVTALTEIHRQELRAMKSKIKVTSLSPGVVVTEVFEASMKATGMEINPEWVELPTLDAKDIADGVIYVLGTPPHVQVHELTIKPVGEMI